MFEPTIKLIVCPHVVRFLPLKTYYQTVASTKIYCPAYIFFFLHALPRLQYTFLQALNLGFACEVANVGTVPFLSTSSRSCCWDRFPLGGGRFNRSSETEIEKTV